MWLEFFKDDVGALSCTRLLAMTTTFVILAMWVWGMVMAGQYIPLPSTEAGVITACQVGRIAHSYWEYGPGCAKGGHEQ